MIKFYNRKNSNISTEGIVITLTAKIDYICKRKKLPQFPLNFQEPVQNASTACHKAILTNTIKCSFGLTSRLSRMEGKL
jgi:hypothetical protein